MVGDQAETLQRDLGTDRDKLDEYFTSVRELEQRLVQAEEWEKAQAQGRCRRRATSTPNADPIGHAAHVRPHPPGPADRFDPADHRFTPACWRSQPPIGGRPWTITTCRTTARTRTRSTSSASLEDELMKTFRRPAGQAEGDAGRRRDLARPDDGPLRQQPGQRQQPRHHEPADPAGRRRLQARPAPGLRPRRTTRRCAISTCRCCSGWASRSRRSVPARARSRGLEFMAGCPSPDPRRRLRVAYLCRSCLLPPRAASAILRGQRPEKGKDGIETYVVTSDYQAKAGEPVRAAAG